MMNWLLDNIYVTFGDMMNWLLDNIYVTFGDQLFRQVTGIPMGTDCAPFLANLFLYAHEYKWIDKQKKLNNGTY